MKKFILPVLFFLSMNIHSQDNMLCMGHHWTEDETNLMMKKFAQSWNDIDSWEKRAAIIKQGIIDGMKLKNMPALKGEFNPVIRNSRKMDGYIVENIAIESFPGFYQITGNLYRPDGNDEKYAAILSRTCEG